MLDNNKKELLEIKEKLRKSYISLLTSNFIQPSYKKSEAVSKWNIVDFAFDKAFGIDEVKEVE